ncbi:uncharacterized protein LAESUDRAFT_177130 [Laetiporus sulphureus 93-53]|uniref:Uncharacterized protein n=1 Tax=Laetiporus sulphureus 93-53 TaxID=1314785 RepID=A0A165E831_9APHY|nr:uncharacterized protein LAESUDRAFT_177130 [Laetiporus sulphureus 93-53]KZT06425.1 hypothetical protein LAESUDRAFT_177130 [Laetiporus sulphureus 93-53]
MRSAVSSILYSPQTLVSSCSSIPFSHMTSRFNIDGYVNTWFRSYNEGELCVKHLDRLRMRSRSNSTFTLRQLLSLPRPCVRWDAAWVQRVYRGGRATRVPTAFFLVLPGSWSIAPSALCHEDGESFGALSPKALSSSIGPETNCSI